MSKYVVLGIRLGALKTFLDRVTTSVDEELSHLFQVQEDGDFADLSELDDALFIPMESEAIAIRATLYELNALIEWELQALAVEPYTHALKYAEVPKFMGDAPLKKIRFASDLPRGEMRQLIESYYTVDFDELPGSSEVDQIRRAVNAFKHRGGFKDLRRDSWSCFPEGFKLDRDEAYRAIDATSKFLRTLWKHIDSSAEQRATAENGT
jgi:hypothetical protein